MRLTDIFSRVFEKLISLGASPGDFFLIAYSGGPDSGFLAASIARLKACGMLTGNAALAYLDHGMRSRDEREAEGLSVVAMAKALELPLRSGRVNPGLIETEARREGSGIEDAARRARLSFLETERIAVGARWILTGHTLDDQRETVLIRALQGSGAAGLRGIPGRRDPFLRPLLDIPRVDALNWLEASGLPFWKDSTNSKDDYLRNRVRHGLLPLTKLYFPGVERALDALSRKASLDEECLAEIASKTIEWAYRYGRIETDADAFFSAHPSLRTRALYKAFDALASSSRLPWRMVMEIASIPRPNHSGRLFEAAGFELSLGGSRLILRRLDRREGGKGKREGYRVDIGEIGTYSVGKAGSLTLYWGELAEPRDDCLLWEGSFEFPLVVRSRLPGDAIASREGAKSLKKLMNEWAVPQELRAIIPVLEDARGIVAVLGSSFGYKDRFAERGIASAPSGARGLVITLSRSS